MSYVRSARPDGPGGCVRGVLEPRPGAAPAGPPAPPRRAAASRLLGGHVLAFLRERGLASADGRARVFAFADQGAPDPGADDLTAGAAGLDSLALLELLSRLTQTFELQRTGVEDHMLIEPRLSAWADLLERHWSLLGDTAGIVFRTSGSTDEPRAVRHGVDKLRSEAAQHGVSTLQAAPTRIVAMVPVQHIYGAIFTAFLPDRLGVPVLDLSQAPPSRLARVGGAGDLVIGTPFTWDLLLKAVPVLPKGMHGIVSAAPAPAELWPRAEAAGLYSLTEIYGATETGGIGTRSSGGAPFDLLPTLSFARRSAGEPVTIEALQEKRSLDVQDRIERCGPRQFHVLGRHDGAVQIGGVNVSPEETRRCIAEIDGVAEVAVRFRNGRLHAFVVPEAGIGDVHALVARIRAVLAGVLAAPARPETVSTGTALPRDCMGKLRAWPVRQGDEPHAGGAAVAPIDAGLEIGRAGGHAGESPDQRQGVSPGCAENGPGSRA